jgi:hypothetical protein
MAEFALKSLPVPDITTYPPTFQGMVDFLSTYLYFDDKINFKSYVKSLVNPTPISETSDKIWFQLDANGGPVAIFNFSNPNWVEFQPFKFGDMILTPSTSAVSSPWGNPGQGYGIITYSGSGSTTSGVTAPSAPPAPAGFKYKVYVGRH